MAARKGSDAAGGLCLQRCGSLAQEWFAPRPHEKPTWRRRTVLTQPSRLVAITGLVVAATFLDVAAQPAKDADLWLTVHGDPNDRASNLVEVRPEPTGLDQRVVLDLRVSRDRERTSFRGQKYRSYYAKAVVNCSTQKAWYLWLSYYAEPSWSGQAVAREEYREGEAPVLFKDVPGQPYKRLIAAACRVRG